MSRAPIAEEKRKSAESLFGAGKSINEVAKTVGIGVATASKIKAELPKLPADDAHLAHIASDIRGLARPIIDLHNDPANARKHPERNAAAIKASLARFGQKKPIVARPVNGRLIIVAGNGTLDSAKALGWTHLAVSVQEMSDAEATAYAIADNKTAELAEWDDEILAGLLGSLDADLQSVTGFDDAEIQALISDAAGGTDGLTDPDDVPEQPPAITQRGDVWVMGGHRLICGDSTNAYDVQKVMNGELAALCFTSPPYGQQRDYTEASDVSDWDKLMQGVFGNLPMAPNGQVLVNLGLIHRENEVLPYWDGWIQWMRSKGWRRFAWYVWDQGAGMMGDWAGRLAPSFEFVFHFNKAAIKPEKWVEKKPESVAVGHGSGQRQKNGKVTALSSPSASLQPTKIADSVIRVIRNKVNDIARASHPATFPVEFPEYIMQCWDGLAYEPFSGSGTTIIAAEKLGRRCFAIEIEPRYVDVAVQRWCNFTGKDAVRESDGAKWSDLSKKATNG